MADLFQRGDFMLHSGARSDFKIDCDALTDTDLDTLACLIAERVEPFVRVRGIPTGGLKLARALACFAVHQSQRLLIVDDVLTTGGSMEIAKFDVPSAIGAVIFARGPCPDWIMPLFQMTEARDDG